MQTIRYVLVGLGNLGRRFCEVIAEKTPLLRERYSLELVLVGAADSRGAAYDGHGLDPRRVAQLKRDGGSVSAYPGAGRGGWDALSLVEAADADLLLEALPVNLDKGAEPGLSCIRAAMRQGMHVVAPDKGPLVVAYRELHDLAKANGVQLRFDGTVAGGLPAINLGARDLRGAIVQRIETVPNLVTGYVMDMLADGVAWDAALERARAEGVLEADAAWDLDGWDAAAKLVILANAVLDYPATLDGVARSGIAAVGAEELASARREGCCYRLLACAERQPDGDYGLSVAPTRLSPEHPLGRLGRKQMGVVYTTDIYGVITAIIDEPNPVPSAMTMLRDLLDIYGA
ncbi:MAG TPA: homoserine dehydrogenase [Anaerolineae bacterium]|nr:homoserine dehydrogenase [Anaerolineae bacterium]HQH39748.1 homoserine dehydrogenase [Anaerolineae bacterium]